MLKNLTVQALIFIAIFNLISWFKESSLLSTSGDIKAPEFELMDINNQKVTLASLSDKPTLLFFWAPWCSVCKLTMPNVQDFYQSHSEQFNVVSVALSFQSPDEIVNFMHQREYSFTTLLGNADVSQDYKIQAFPTYYVIDTDGIVVNKSLGYSTEIGMLLRSMIL
ncbi:redoxin domain-containing protein [Psychrosphaera sp. F3M07]|uniref:redoxin domain-containing protein n=1 Tax=Psychrosphaera sp. F3M07 TaxID=2841560 RepID=UPI001C08756A|nr:redoxin domain-containing protein [Psychrosphaera sp. F3M07]MBU2918589.1 redoxin domain-containing protein [Psychrosphaera sp. F3M07]